MSESVEGLWINGALFLDIDLREYDIRKKRGRGKISQHVLGESSVRKELVLRPLVSAVSMTSH
jgi:hypothetical protein